MTLRELGEWCLSWPEDLDKQVAIIDPINYRTKPKDLTIVVGKAPRILIENEEAT